MPAPHPSSTVGGLLDSEKLLAQTERQRKATWTLEEGLPWAQGVDPTKFLVPLDDDAVLFPGATPEQRLAISQMMGLVINATIAEMEAVIHKLRDIAWESLLDRFPVNPEAHELGELFFEEEAKHSLAFRRYNTVFCKSLDIEETTLQTLLPQAFGSSLLGRVISNARSGGNVFWWIVSAVEEISIEIYQMLHPHARHLDGLYFQLHRRHLEDEARHRSYAFMMLDLVDRAPQTLFRKLAGKTELILAQSWTAAWVLGQLQRIESVRLYEDQHPFFKTLSGCLPLMHQLWWGERIRRLFFRSPYVSLVLNPNHHRHTRKIASRLGVLQLPWPAPQGTPLSAA